MFEICVLRFPHSRTCTWQILGPTQRPTSGLLSEKKKPKEADSYNTTSDPGEEKRLFANARCTASYLTLKMRDATALYRMGPAAPSDPGPPPPMACSFC
jgi:hypothetical protein